MTASCNEEKGLRKDREMSGDLYFLFSEEDKERLNSTQ